MTGQQNQNNFSLNWILGILLALVIAGIILLPKEKIKTENSKTGTEEKTVTKTENAPESIISPLKDH